MQREGLGAELRGVVEFFNSAAYLSGPTAYGVAELSYPLRSSGGGDGYGDEVEAPDANPALPFVHLFETRGILQHSDFGPQAHLTDLGAAKVAAHLMQFIKITFGWDMRATGPECVPPSEASSPLSTLHA